MSVLCVPSQRYTVAVSDDKIAVWCEECPEEHSDVFESRDPSSFPLEELMDEVYTHERQVHSG